MFLVRDQALGCCVCQAEKLQPGAIVFTSQRLESELFEHLGEAYDCFDVWDLAACAEFDFHIQRKL